MADAMNQVGVRRLVAALVAVGCAAVLGLAAWLDPSPAGLGTHARLGLPPCGWIALIDVPCPTCGMTTAFSHAAHGDLPAAFAAQPLGGLLAVLTAAVFAGAVWAAATGARLEVIAARLWGRRAAWLVGFAVVGAWAYKIVAYRELLG